IYEAASKASKDRDASMRKGRLRSKSRRKRVRELVAVNAGYLRVAGLDACAGSRRGCGERQYHRSLEAPARPFAAQGGPSGHTASVWLSEPFGGTSCLRLPCSPLDSREMS